MLKLSVVQVVEFACRSGDLGAGGGPGPSAREGIRAHQRLQRQLADSFEAEVTVSSTVECPEGSLQLRGRVDLVQAGAQRPVLAEIKSCYGPPSRLPPGDIELHWSQLRLYAYCYLAEQPASDIELRMYWYDLQQDRVYEDSRHSSLEEIQAFTRAAAAQCLRWHHLLAELDGSGRADARALQFPFAGYRPGQRAMANTVYRTLRDRGHLLCEAPTGIGKTISSLFPAIKALGEEVVDKVVYLTAKNSGRALAMSTLATLAKQGLQLSTLQIQAREKACPCRNGGCEPDTNGRCPLTLGFFDRLAPARRQLLEARVMDLDTVAATAAEHQLCPFELTQQMLPWAQLVVCDYNYVFDPLVRLAWFGDNRDRIALLVDETHNLVDRSRNMYSARLLRSQARQAAASCKTSQPALAKRITALARAMERHQKAVGQEESVGEETPATVDRAVHRLLEQLSQEVEGGLGAGSDIALWLKEVYRYRHIADLFGPHHRSITRQSGVGRYRDIDLRLRCLDASAALAESYGQFHGVVLFSATLRPQQYYHQTLGLPDTSQYQCLPSPFPPEHLGAFIHTGIDTRYRAREASLAPLCDVIAAVYRSRPGNYLVFFPSYHYLAQVAATFAHNQDDIELLLQEPDSDETQRTAFLSHFQAGGRKLGFAIMGGIYGEGIDYLGDALIGAIVIGVGLPAMDTEQDLIRRDFEAQGRDGFDFAYRYPGLGRVLQAAGRVIRSETDRGVVVLVDQRFGQAFYRQLMPTHWHCRYVSDAEQLGGVLDGFWHGAIVSD